MHPLNVSNKRTGIYHQNDAEAFSLTFGAGSFGVN
jgi:hypothetical protein